MNEEERSNQIIQRICECGWNAYLCGGAVRDLFMSFDPNDFDIVTDATPQELEIIFKDQKVKTVGASFLVTLINGVEVSTYRSDRNVGPGRENCITKVCKTLDEDLSRRDFTINSIAVCPYSGDVVDPFNGRKDLERKTIKFVGNPDDRIYEDYVRMLRAARFACLINGSLDNDTKEAIKRNKEYVSLIAPERIRREILKAMKYKKPSIFFDILYETGILKIILPELEKLYRAPGGVHHNETLYEHSMIAGDSLSSKDPVLRLIGYLHDIGKPTSWIISEEENFINHENFGMSIIDKIFQRYKFTNKENERAKGLTKLHMRSIDSFNTGKSTRRFLKRCSDFNINWKDWLKLKIADNKANLKRDNYSRKKINDIVLSIYKARHQSESGEFKITDLDINGLIIMKEFNLSPGPVIGSILKKLLEIVLDDPSLNNQEILIEQIKMEKLYEFNS